MELPGSKFAVLDACARLLRPVIRLLLKSGVGWREFSDLAKAEFVNVATADYGLRGRPTNATRVAILTGIDRREVQRLRESAAGGDVPEFGFMSKPTQLLDGWHGDPEFIDRKGKPKALDFDGTGTPDFSLLVRRYAPGITAVAMRKQLQSAGILEADARGRLFPVKRHYIPHERSPDQVRLWGSVLEDVGTTLEHNLTRAVDQAPRFERRALSLRVDARDLPEFEAFLEQEGQQFLVRVDEWLGAHQLERGRADADATTSPVDSGMAVRLGAGVYLIKDRNSGRSKHK